jgi:hypothetical protein
MSTLKQLKIDTGKNKLKLEVTGKLTRGTRIIIKDFY